MKYSLIVVFAFCINCVIVKAQNKNYQEDYKGGYRGGFIKGIEVSDTSLNFLVIGDWGRCGEFFQKEVAEQMANTSVCTDASFVISTGDNFYPKGVASVEDPLWNKSYENIYSQYSLQKDWYVVLGNHDYKINPQAEVDYSARSSRWIMPSRYYSFKLLINGDTNQKVLFVFLDTNPFIEKYYNDKEYGKHVRSQDTVAQKKWLIETLEDKDPSIRWKIVVGHHPLYTSGKRIKSNETFQFRNLMEPLFKKYKVNAYICGHEHQLEYIKPEGKTHYFISGAGSEARDVNGKLPESKFKVSDHGFMLFSLSTYQLEFHVINWEGKILHKEVVK